MRRLSRVEGALTGNSRPPRAAPGMLELEPPYLASLTAEQRADLRLWDGRITLLERVKCLRRYGLLTVGAWALGIAGFAAGIGIAPPLVLAPIVPVFMSVRLWKRGTALRQAGLRLRRVFLARRSRMVIAAPALPSSRQLRKLAPRPVLESPHGASVRRAAEDRAAIAGIMHQLSKVERAMLPDIEPTVKALVERVAHLAKTLHRLDADFDPGAIAGLDARIMREERDPDSTDALRQLALLKRQRISLEHFVKQRAALARQLDSAGLALGNLRLDLIKVRTSGLESALGDVSNATQEARALAREIGVALEAAAEVRALAPETRIR
ncbi:MAG: hypothetical protein ABIP93_20245 [Gemmatimonadaceae bacterium]